MIGKLKICTAQDGDKVLTWDTEASPELIAAVESAFNEALPGRMAVKTNGPNSGEQIRTFDPTAEEIIMFRNLQGG